MKTVYTTRAVESTRQPWNWPAMRIRKPLHKTGKSLRDEGISAGYSSPIKCLRLILIVYTRAQMNLLMGASTSASANRSRAYARYLDSVQNFPASYET